MLNFVICDDNLDTANKLEDTLERIFINYNYNASVVFKSGNPYDIINYIDNNHVDVLLLDINLKCTMDGLKLAEEIRNRKNNAYIIFTTCHLEYAMVAYKYKTFDYLPKPITYDRLKITISRLFEDANKITQNYLKIDNKNTIVNENEIHYIKKDGMKLIFHTTNCDYESYNSFNKFAYKLPRNYVRCHKSYIANLSQINTIESNTSTITFKDGDTCNIGPKYKKNFMEELKNYGIHV